MPAHTNNGGITSLMRKAGWRLVSGHLRPPLDHALEGWFWAVLPIEPPTTTHHSKTIGRNFKTGRPGLFDDPALIAARTRYLLAIPERRQLVPLAGPVKLWVTFMFGGPREPAPIGPWHVNKPDLDNSIKALKDTLAVRGYLAGDEQVAWEDTQKRWTGGPAGHIQIVARTLAPHDDGAPPAIETAAEQFRIYPAPWKAAADVQTTRKGMKTVSDTLAGRPVNGKRTSERYEDRQRAARRGSWPAMK